MSLFLRRRVRLNLLQLSRNAAIGLIVAALALAGCAGPSAKPKGLQRALKNQQEVQLLPLGERTPLSYGPLPPPSLTAFAAQRVALIEARDPGISMREALGVAPGAFVRTGLDALSLKEVGRLTESDMASCAFVWPHVWQPASSAFLPLPWLPHEELPEGMINFSDRLAELPGVSWRLTDQALITYAPQPQDGSGELMEYQELAWPLRRSEIGLYQRPAGVARVPVTEASLRGMLPSTRWSRLNQSLPEWATAEDARIWIASRQIEFLLTQASVRLFRVPVSMEEAQLASGLAPINLGASGSDGDPRVSIQWDGQQAYTFNLRFPSGVETSAILFFHGAGGTATNNTWLSPEALDVKAPHRTWQPFAMYYLVNPEDAKIPLGGH